MRKRNDCCEKKAYCQRRADAISILDSGTRTSINNSPLCLGRDAMAAAEKISAPSTNGAVTPWDVDAVAPFAAAVSEDV
jgi:hypothetical protein